MGYQKGEVLFLKLFDHDPNANYPDRNSNVELYTDGQILELETLGGLVTLAPEEFVSHKETRLLKSEIGFIQTEQDALHMLAKIF